MTVELTIDSPVRFIHHKEHGTRLIFVDGSINPRNELGKFGVDFHNNAAALSRSVVKAEVKVLADDGGYELREINFNRNSLLKYLRAYRQQEIASSITNEDLVSLLNSTLGNTNFKPELRHAGERNQRLLNSHTVGDNIRGSFFSWLYQKTIQTLSALRKRFFFVSSEAGNFKISEILAKFRFKKALEEVPAYREHVGKDKHYAETEEKTFADVPVTTKENYIKANSEHDRYLHRHGVYPKGKKKYDTSTGTTGKPTSWVRSALEVKTVKKSLKVAAQMEYGTRQIHYINAFALGPWATGLTVNEMMRANGSSFAAAPDVGKILDNMEDVYREENGQIDDDIKVFIAKHGGGFADNDVAFMRLIRDLLEEKFKNKFYNVSARLDELEEAGVDFIHGHQRKIIALVDKIDAYRMQVVVTGYPSFMKVLVDAAAARNIEFSKYQARAVVGGQAISEALREGLLNGGFTKVNSSYGLSDCDINIGVETDFEMQFRKKLEECPALAEELYGKGKGVPMVFHYDPLNYHIEANKENKLILTCNREDRSSPRVRYCPDDEGRVYASSDIEALLIKYGIKDLKPAVNFPLLFVWGRESAVPYRAAKVAFTELERAILNIDSDNKYEKRAFYSYVDEAGVEQFDIWVELKEGEEVPPLLERQHFLAKLIIQLAAVNQDFKYQLELPDHEQLPKLRYYTKGRSPIGEANGHHKQVLVITEKNLPANYQQPKDLVADTEINKNQLYNFGNNPLMTVDGNAEVVVQHKSQLHVMDDYDAQVRSPHK